MTPPSASIVIPVYNECDGIVRALESLFQEPWMAKYEVIVVDDGSTDGTREKLRALHERAGRFLLLQHDSNRGYGAALKTGIIEARGEYIVITDADNSYPNQRIDELVEETRTTGFDMVVGARTQKGVQVPWSRRPAKWVLNRFAGYLARRTIPDLNSGLRVFRRSIALSHLGLLCDRFSFTSTLTLIMLCEEYRVRYVPIEYYRRSGRSKIRPVQDTLNFFLLLLTTTCYFRPLRVFLPPALLFLALGGLITAYQAIVLANITTVSLLLLQTGFTFFALALVTDLVVRNRRTPHPRHVHQTQSSSPWPPPHPGDEGKEPPCGSC